ncbi:MAG: substrate-binding periplasmic protein [Desulfobulbus sp.]
MPSCSSLLRTVLLPLLAALLLCACQQQSGTRQGALNRLFTPAPLRVGIVTDNPPLAYQDKNSNTIKGLEARFAQGLAAHLDKPLQLVELPASGLAQALGDKQVDIVMAGLTAAEIQEQQLVAANPYLISGQTVLVHLNDFNRLGTGTRNLSDPELRLGVVRNGTGEHLLKRLRPAGTLVRYTTADEGVHALLRNRIDGFVHSMPANFFAASLHVEEGLTPGRTLLTREPMAWALRPGNQALLREANAYLATLKQSGELQQMLEQAIPFYKNTAYSPKF